MDIDEVLERTQADLFWLPDDVQTVDRPEILYVSCARDQGYLNTVLRLDSHDTHIPALVAEVDDAHATVGSRWMLTRANRRAAVERPLATAGYEPAHEHYAYAIDVASHRARATPGVVARPVDDMDDLRAWTRVSARAFDRNADFDEQRLALEFERSRAPGARVHRFVAWDVATGEPVAAAGLTIHPALRFGFLWAGGTVPEARGRGAYSALVAARIERAKKLQIENVGLYARIETSAPIVERQGFRRHGPMTYWMRPARSVVAGPERR